MKHYPIVFVGGPLAGSHAAAERLPPALYFLIDEKRQIYVYVRSDTKELVYDWSQERSDYMSENYDAGAISVVGTPQPQVIFHGA